MLWLEIAVLLGVALAMAMAMSRLSLTAAVTSVSRYCSR